MKSIFKPRTLAALLVMILSSLALRVAHAECFDPAVESGAAFKDKLGEYLLVMQVLPPSSTAKFGTTVVGVGVKGSFYGCQVSETAVRPLLAKGKKMSLYLPIVGGPVKGFELDVSTESRRILAARSIQVAWEVVDRSQGVTATCAKSSSTAFESFLYGALRAAKARRCTEPEIESLVGRAKQATR